MRYFSIVWVPGYLREQVVKMHTPHSKKYFSNHMGAEPGGAPLRPKALLWIDPWWGGESQKVHPNSKRENVKTQKRDHNKQMIVHHEDARVRDRWANRTPPPPPSPPPSFP